MTVQAQILDLLRISSSGCIPPPFWCPTNLGKVDGSGQADRVAIMYAGRIVEIGTAEEVYYDPRHPYTKGLLRSLPALAKRHGALHTIPGMPPTLIDPPEGDAFACRNPQALAIDYQQRPPCSPSAIPTTRPRGCWIPERPSWRPCRKEKSTMSDILLDVQHLTHCFPLPAGRRFGR